MPWFSPTVKDGSVLVDLCCGLRADIPSRAGEFQSADSIFTGDARKPDAVIDRLGCVISHASIVVLASDHDWSE
jgi:hypothetical protein